MNDRAYFILIFYFRKNLPSFTTFYYIYFSFKFIGLILATQNLREYESSNNKITSLYSILSKVLLFDSSFIYISKYYNYICFIIFLLSIFLIMYFLIIFFRLKKTYIKFKKRDDFNHIKYLDNLKNIKLELKIFIYFLIFISSLSQYLLEYLLIGIILPFIKKAKKNLNSDKYLSNFLEQNGNKIIIIIINTFSFFFYIFIDYFILYLNDTKGFLNRYGIDIYSNKLIQIFSIFLTLFQPLIGFSYIFKKKNKEYFRIIICIIAVLLSLIYLLLSIKRFNFYFDSKIPKFILFLVCFSFYGGIFELFLLYFINQKNQMTQKYSISKFLFSIITTFIFYNFILNYNENFFQAKLTKNLFKTSEKDTDISEIYLYIKYYCLLREDPSNFELFQILYNHKKICQIKECFCILIKKKLNIKKMYDWLNKDEYSIIGEQEIINRISYLFKSKIYTKEIEDYILLHCQYIYAIKKSEYHALYLCTMYLNCKLKLSEITKYYLIETKKEILYKIQSKKDFKKNILLVGNMKNISKNLYNKIAKLKYFKHFIIFNDNIKYLIKDIFQNLEKIIVFRKQVNQNSKLGAMNEKSFNTFLNICGEIKQYDENIKKTIINYSKSKRKDDYMIKNNEICYILSNYFVLLHKKIPKKIKNKFKFIFNYWKISNKLINDFSEFNMNSPIIFSQNKSDNFVINYMHTSLSNQLDFSQDEIKEKNIEELIPSNINKEHILLIKQFCILDNPKFQNSHTFILNKSKCLVNISLHCRILPTLHYFPNIITNVRIIQNKKNLSLHYHAIVDKKGYFINICPEFENNFFFDIKNLKQLSITFSDFFGIPPLEKKIIRERNKFYLDEDKANTIFDTIPNKEMFYLRKKKESIEEIKKKKYHFSGYINKKNIITGINNINHIFDEKGYDNEWYILTKCLNQRFIFSEDYSPSLKKSKESRFFKSTFTENYHDENLLIIDYYLKQIERKKYYMIKLIETTDIIQLTKSIKNLRKIIEKKKKNPIAKSNKFQLTSKRSEISQISSSINSTNTNKPFLHSPINEDMLNNNNFNYNNISPNNNNSKNISNHSLIVNNSMMNNSKIPFNEDNKNTLHELNIIQNQISRIKRWKNLRKNRRNKIYIKNNLNLLNPQNPIPIEENTNKIIQNYTFILFSSFGVVISLSIILIFLKLTKIYEHKDIFQFNIYMEVLKSNTYLSALYSFILCYQYSFNTSNYNTKNFIESKKQNFQDNLAKFNSYLDKIKTNNKLNVIYDYLYGKYNFTTIEKNWDISVRQSSILEEIKLISFDLYQIYYNENNTCNFINSFFEKNYEKLNENNNPPSELEQFTFYGIQNTFHNFKLIFEKITTHTSNILFGYYKNYFYFITFYGILIIFFTILCYLIIFEKLTDDKNQIKELLICIFVEGKNSDNQEIFEIKVSCFKNMFENFNEDNIKKFEQSKTKLIAILIKKMKDLHISENKNNKESSKKNNNNTNKSTYNLKNNIYLPKSVSISYSILTFFLILILSIVIINIFYALYIKNTFIFSVIMAMNFLERIPKLFEVVYYAIISFSLVDGAFIGNYESFYEQSIIDEYLNFYEVKIIFENNSQLYNMKESYFPILFLKGKMIENNLKIFIGKKIPILKNIKKIEIEFNYNDNLCYASSIYSSNDLKNNQLSYIQYFKLINEKIKLCYIYNFGSMNGLLTEINYIYQEITNLFYDFILSKNKTNIAIHILSSSDINRMILNFNFVLEYVFNSYSYFIMKDINFLYLNTIRIEVLLSIILLLILLFVVIYVFLLIGKGNYKYKKLLKFFYKMY